MQKQQNGRCSIDFIYLRGMRATQLKNIMGALQVSVDDTKMHSMAGRNSVTWCGDAIGSQLMMESSGGSIWIFRMLQSRAMLAAGCFHTSGMNDGWMHGLIETEHSLTDAAAVLEYGHLAESFRCQPGTRLWREIQNSQCSMADLVASEECGFHKVLQGKR